MKKKMVFAFIAIFACLLLTGCGSKTYGLNEKATSKSDNISITVLGVEDVTINEGELSLSNGDYTKVKLTIENTGSDAYTWTSLNFMLGEKSESFTALTQSDYLPTTVEAGQSITGYIYFDKTDAKEFKFISYSLTSGSQEIITFNLK